MWEIQPNQKVVELLNGKRMNISMADLNKTGQGVIEWRCIISSLERPLVAEIEILPLPTAEKRRSI
jgi:hypothetical protein